jgi:8-oxo-dGTP pyrophosphatase MutT (NUDIX family)
MDGHSLTMFDRGNLPNIIKEILITRDPKYQTGSSSQWVHASVLIPIFKDDGDYKVLFTERTRSVEHHKGQISFPGGKVDEEDDTFEETALREAHEEIGLAKEDVTILGRIDDALTAISDFIVHPFVGFIPHPYEFKINVREVKRLVRIPIEVFFSDDSLYKRDWAEIDGSIYHGTVYHYDGDLIWGATARIMQNLVDVVCERLDLPVERE